MKRLKAVKCETLKTGREWDSKAGTKCAQIEVAIKGDPAIYTIIGFKDVAEDLSKHLSVGSVFRADFGETKGDGESELQCYRVYPEQIKHAHFKTHKEIEDDIKTDKLYRNKGLRKVYVTSQENGVRGFVWEKGTNDIEIND